jgi:hypothetical protein
MLHWERAIDQAGSRPDSFTAKSTVNNQAGSWTEPARFKTRQQALTCNNQIPDRTVRRII